MSWREQQPTTARVVTPSRLRAAVTGAVVGVAALLLLVALGRTIAAAVLGVVVVVVTVARLVSPRFDAAAGRLLHTVGTVVGHVLNVVLLGSLFLVVLVPAWLLSRLGAWDTLRPGGARPGRWQVMRRHPWDLVASRSFAQDPRPSGARRLHGAALVGIPVAVVALLVTGPLRGTIDELVGDGDDQAAVTGFVGSDETEGTWEVTGSPPSRAGDPLLAERAAWAPEALTGNVESWSYDPNLSIRIRDITSPYLNIENRVRRSYVPDLSEGALDVWFFGSSALFGISVIRDDHTIVSEIVRLAEAEGVPVRASNFAVSGYETWQEVMLMAQMLTERPDPDLVVIYGGFNDLHNYMQPGAPTEVSSVWANDISSALQEAGAKIPPTDPTLVGRIEQWSPQNAATIYDRGIEIAEDILASRGIPLHNFLQPSLWTRERPEDVATLEGMGSDEAYRASYGRLYDAAREAIASDVVDLADALDDLPGVVYWDEVHHNEAGNAEVAAAAYETLGPAFRDLWESNRP